MPISIATETRAAVFGYGVEGRAACAWLQRRGVANVRIIAKERPADLPSGTAFAQDDEPGALEGIDVVLRSPGIKPGHPILLAAGTSGTPITTGTSIFVETVRAAGIPIVGVTGSKGKSTTSTLIHLALTEGSIANVLVGNIGAAALDSLDDVLARRPVVIYEMSSYQTHDLALGPSVAVITRLFPEHLDWHGSAEAYYAGKLAIARTQRPDDTTTWNAADPEIASRVPLGPARHVAYGDATGVRFSGGTFDRGGRILFNDRTMRLRGWHNRLNACAAFTAAEMFGASPRDMQEVLSSFAGLPHRLEDLGVHAGVRWINDSISTAPEAAVAALEAHSGEVATYVGGGADRGFDFEPLAAALASHHVANVILLPPGGPRMAEAIGGDAHLVADLEQAVAVAASLTPPGKTVLFSPASPSYGTYRNFEERGDDLRRLVRGLKG